MLKIVENLWAIGAPLRTQLGSQQRSSDPLVGGEGVLPLQRTPSLAVDLRPFNLAPMENPKHALASNLQTQRFRVRLLELLPGVVDAK